MSASFPRLGKFAAIISLNMLSVLFFFFFFSSESYNELIGPLIGVS